jgi:hypothetical protein
MTKFNGVFMIVISFGLNFLYLLTSNFFTTLPYSYELTSDSTFLICNDVDSKFHGEIGNDPL